MSTQPLTERELSFLDESNRIEDISDIDYHDPRNAQPGKGHVGAYLDSQEVASRRAALTTESICRWQRWITEEQVAYGHALPPRGAGVLRSPDYPQDVRVGRHVAPSFRDVPALMTRYVDELNATLTRLGSRASDEDFASTLGDFFQRFEAIHPFVDGNGRTGRLIANHIATALGAPIIVFRVTERPAFYRAHRCKMAMRVFMADKIREATFWPGRGVLERQEAGTSSDRFDGLVVERHSLLRKRAEWAKAVEERDTRADSGQSD